jgi:hypothetical protein
MIVNSEEELVKLVRQHVADGGQIESINWKLTSHLGFESRTDPNQIWMLPFSRLKDAYGNEFARMLTQDAFKLERCFNHQHGWDDASLCDECLVREVITN